MHKNENDMTIDEYVARPRAVRRHLDSITSSAIKLGTGKESCLRREEPDCKGGDTRYYGEMLADSAFTGWRGPFCSAKCYKLHYPAERDNG